MNFIVKFHWDNCTHTFYLGMWDLASPTHLLLRNRVELLRWFQKGMFNKSFLLVTLWKGKPRYKFLDAKHKAVRHWQGKYLRHAIRLSILSTVLYYKYSDTSKQHASNQHLHNNTSTDNWKSLFFLRWAIHGVHKVSLWHLCFKLVLNIHLNTIKCKSTKVAQLSHPIWTPSSVNPRKLHNCPKDSGVEATIYCK